MAEEQKYIGAPYNFISLSEQVFERYNDISQLPAHNRIEKGRISGIISYEVKAELPIIINDGNGNFYKNSNGKYTIPGSSIRGLVRSNAQILGLSSIGVDVDDYRLMYRVVGHAKDNPLKKRYSTILGTGILQLEIKGERKSISILKNVEAGYLKKENGKYKIYPVVFARKENNRGKMNYYPLSERNIRDPNNRIEFFFEKDYRMQNKSIVGKKGIQNINYHPYFESIYYQVNQGNHTVTDVVKFEKSGYKPGYVISSGYVGDKKMQYIIPQKDANAEGFEVEPKFIRNYLIDFNRKENLLGKDATKDFFRLPKEGEEKPVFYIYDNAILYFGFTPNLRLYFDHTIQEGLPNEHKFMNQAENAKVKLDYNRSLFGFTTKEHSYKSRLCFFDAVAIKVEKGKNEARVLAEPKPSSYFDYLKGEDKNTPVTYNDIDEENSVSLRGMKQYWLHNSLVQNETGNNEKILSKFTPLQSDAMFQGKVHFKNLSEDELGLLLWSIALNSDSAQNIGQGKPYGFGKVKINITDMQLFDDKKLYSLNEFCMETESNVADSGTYIDIYKNYISEKIGRDIEKMPNISEFFLMKRQDKIPKNENIRYMSIQNKEYKNRKKPLPGVTEVVQNANRNISQKNSNIKNNDKGNNFSSHNNKKVNPSPFRGNSFSDLKNFKLDDNN